MAETSASKSNKNHSTHSEQLYVELTEELRIFRQLLIDHGLIVLKNCRQSPAPRPREDLSAARTNEKPTNSIHFSIAHCASPKQGGVTQNVADEDPNDNPSDHLNCGGPGCRLPQQIVCRSCGSGSVVYEAPCQECEPHFSTHPWEDKPEDIVDSPAPGIQAMSSVDPNRQTEEIGDEKKNKTSKRDKEISNDLKDKRVKANLSPAENAHHRGRKPSTTSGWHSSVNSTASNYKKAITDTAKKVKDRCDHNRSRKRSRSRGWSMSHGGEKHQCRRKDAENIDRKLKQKTNAIVGKVCQTFDEMKSTEELASKSCHTEKSTSSSKHKFKRDNAHPERTCPLPDEHRSHTHRVRSDRRASPHWYSRFALGCSGSSRFSSVSRRTENINSNNIAIGDVRRYTDGVPDDEDKEVKDWSKPNSTSPDDEDTFRIRPKVLSYLPKGKYRRPRPRQWVPFMGRPAPNRHPLYYGRCHVLDQFPECERRRGQSATTVQINDGRKLRSFLQNETRNKRPDSHKLGMDEGIKSSSMIKGCDPNNKGGCTSANTKEAEETTRHVHVSKPTGNSKSSDMNSESGWEFIQVPHTLSLVDLRFAEKMEVRGSYSFSEGMSEDISLGIVNAHLQCERRRIMKDDNNSRNRECTMERSFNGPSMTKSLAKILTSAAKLRNYYRMYVRPYVVEFLRAHLAYVKLPRFMFKTNGSVYRYVNVLAIPSCYASDPRILFLDLVTHLQAISPFTTKNNFVTNTKSKRAIFNENYNWPMKWPVSEMTTTDFSMSNAKSLLTGLGALEPMDTSQEIKIDKQNILDKIEEFCDTLPPLSPLIDSMASGDIRQCNILRTLIKDTDLFGNVATYVCGRQTDERMRKIGIDAQRLDWFVKDYASSKLAGIIDYKNLLVKHGITMHSGVRDSSWKRCKSEPVDHRAVNDTCYCFPSSSESVLKSNTNIKVNMNNSNDETNEPVSGSSKEIAPPPTSACFEEDFETVDFSYEYDMLNSPIVLNASDRVYHINDIASENTDENSCGEGSTDVSTILGQIRNSNDILATAMDSAGLSESTVENFLNADFDLDSVIFDQNAVNPRRKPQDADAFLDQIFAGFSSLEDTVPSDNTDAVALVQENDGNQAHIYPTVPPYTEGDQHRVKVYHDMDNSETHEEKHDLECPSFWTPGPVETGSYIGRMCSQPSCNEVRNVQQELCDNKNPASEMLYGREGKDQQCFEPLHPQISTPGNNVTHEALRNTNIAFHFDSPTAGSWSETNTIKIHPTSLTDPAITLRGDEGDNVVYAGNDSVSEDILMLSKLNNSDARNNSKRRAKTVTARVLEYHCDHGAPSKGQTTRKSKRKVQQPQGFLQTAITGKVKPTETIMDAATKSLGMRSQADNRAVAAQVQKYRRPQAMLKRRLRSTSIRHCHSSHTSTILLPPCSSTSVKTDIQNSNNNADILDSSSSDISDEQFACSSTTTTELDEKRQEKLAHRLKQRCRELEKHYRKRYQSPLGSTFASSMPLTIPKQNRSQNSKHGFENGESKGRGKTRLGENPQAGLNKGKRLKSSVVNFVKRIQGGYGDQFPISTRTSKEKRHELCNRYLEYHGVNPTEKPIIKHKKKSKRIPTHEQYSEGEETINITSKGSKAPKTESQKENEGVREPQTTGGKESTDSTQCSSNVNSAVSATSLTSNESVQKSRDEGSLHSKSSAGKGKKKANDKSRSSSETTIRTGRDSPSYISSRPSTPELVTRLQARPLSPAYRLLKKIEQFELDFQTRFPATFVENGMEAAIAAAADPVRPKTTNCSNKRSKKSPTKAQRRREIQSLLHKFENLDIDLDSPRLPSATDFERGPGAKEKLELPPIANAQGFTPRASSQRKSVGGSSRSSPTLIGSPKTIDSDSDDELFDADCLHDELAQDSDKSLSLLFDDGDVNEAELVNKCGHSSDRSSEFSLDSVCRERYSGCDRLLSYSISPTGTDSSVDGVIKDVNTVIHSTCEERRPRLSTSDVRSCLPALGATSLLASSSYNSGDQRSDVERLRSDKSIASNMKVKGEKRIQESFNVTTGDSPRGSISSRASNSSPSQDMDKSSSMETELFNNLDELWASYERLISSDKDEYVDRADESVLSTAIQTNLNHAQRGRNATLNRDTMARSTVTTRDDDLVTTTMNERLLDHNFLDKLLPHEESTGYDIEQLMAKSPEPRSSRCSWHQHGKGTTLSPIFEDPDEEIHDI